MQVVVAQKKAREIMSEEVHQIAESDFILTAIIKMQSHSASFLLVEKGKEGDAWGIVTRKDIIKDIINKVVAAEGAEEIIKVGDIMTRPIVTVDPEMTIRNCALLMKRLGVRRLPVQEGSNIIGVISNKDIFGHMTGSQ